MNRSSKVTIAGGLAVVLLAGGATTFSRWYAEQDVTVAAVESGQLSFTATDGMWLINSLDNAEPNRSFDPKTQKIVPGDVVTFTTEVTPTLVGDNLEATFDATVKNATVAGVDIDVDVETPAGADVAVLTPADSGKPFIAEVTITFPEAASNSFQNTTVSLDTLKLDLKQNAR